jgi:CBS-domain-containing membrane protein
MKKLVVADVMTKQVVKARPAMPLKELARVLAEHHVSALPALDEDDRVIGVVSERDLLRKLGNPTPVRVDRNRDQRPIPAAPFSIGPAGRWRGTARAPS